MEGKWWVLNAPKPKDVRVEQAMRLLQNFWGGVSHTPASEVAEALRKLKPAELGLVRAWVPQGSSGSPTAVRCERAREIVSGVIAEKDKR